MFTREIRCHTGFCISMWSTISIARKPHRTHRIQKRIEGGVDPHLGKLAVVEAGASQPGVVQVEAERLDEVKIVAGVDAETHQIAGVRRNLRAVQHDVEHPAHSPALAAFSMSRINDNAGSLDWMVWAADQCSVSVL